MLSYSQLNKTIDSQGIGDSKLEKKAFSNRKENRLTGSPDYTICQGSLYCVNEFLASVDYAMNFFSLSRLAPSEL